MADLDDLEYLAGWCAAAAGDVTVEPARFARACAALNRVIAARAAPLTADEAAIIKDCIDMGASEGVIEYDEAPSLRAAVDRATGGAGE